MTSSHTGQRVVFTPEGPSSVAQGELTGEPTIITLLYWKLFVTIISKKLSSLLDGENKKMSDHLEVTIWEMTVQ